MDLSKSLRLQDLANGSTSDELLDLTRALHQSNRVAAQLKSSLALVLEREAALQSEKDSLELQLAQLTHQNTDLQDQVDSLKVCFDHAKAQMDVVSEAELAAEKNKNEALTESLRALQSELGLLRQSQSDAYVLNSTAEERCADFQAEKERLEEALRERDKEHAAVTARLKDELAESIRRSKDQIHAIEKKVQAVQSDRVRWKGEKETLEAEIARLKADSERWAEDRQRITDQYEEKLKEAMHDLAVARDSQESTAQSLTELLDRHEELERDYQDAVFHVEELQAQLRASQLSARQLEDTLGQQTSKIRQAMSETAEHLNTSDLQRLRLQLEQNKTQAIEGERLKERAFFRKAICTLLQMPRLPSARLSSVLEALNSIAVDDPETLLKYIAKLPTLVSDDPPERRLRVVLKASDANLSSSDGKSVQVEGKNYLFDRVFCETDKVEQVYEEVAVLTDAFSQGISSSVFVFGRNSFMFNNMVHRTLLGLFKDATQELLLRVSESGDEPNYEQRVSSYAAASKVLETAAKGWRRSSQHIVLSLQHGTGHCLFFASLDADDREMVEAICEALVTNADMQALQPHLAECVAKMTLGLCILTADSEDVVILELGDKLMKSRALFPEELE